MDVILKDQLSGMIRPIVALDAFGEALWRSHDVALEVLGGRLGHLVNIDDEGLGKDAASMQSLPEVGQ